MREPSEPLERLKFMAAAAAPAAVHLLDGRHTTLCGASAKSVRTTRKVSCASCEACLTVLRKAKWDRALAAHREMLRRASELAGGEPLVPGGAPLIVAEPEDDTFTAPTNPPAQAATPPAQDAPGEQSPEREIIGD